MRILIFAKAPRAGAAKTRLIPALGADRAAALAHRMLDRMLASAIEAACGTVELCASPAIDSTDWRDVALPRHLAISAQGEGDLGARLARHALRAIKQDGGVLLVGTDCLELDATKLRDAAQALRNVDTVLHPTFDGGYALLGLRRFDASLFDGIEWSTASVAETTRQRIAQLGRTLHLAATLHDIDEPADLAHVPAEWLR